MKFDYKGTKSPSNEINEFIGFLYSVNENSLWNYRGLTVEIDPTLDYSFNNVLIRWVDVNEGFNDKIIYYNLAEFNNDFKLLN